MRSNRELVEAGFLVVMGGICGIISDYELNYKVVNPYWIIDSTPISGFLFLSLAIISMSWGSYIISSELFHLIKTKRESNKDKE